MRPCWTGVLLALVSMATPTLSQSGDGDYGSGYEAYSPVKAAADEPAKATPNPTLVSRSPVLKDTCSVRFSTRGVSARVLKAQQEEVAYLQAIQHANKAVVENLVQYVGAEMGDQNYEEVIRSNVDGIREDYKTCQEVVEKAEEDLEKQLQGGVLDTLAGMQKIREESASFADMLRATSDIAGRLESSSQTLLATFKQLSEAVKIRS
ncbi:uncharacterized protein si:ch211-142k18.1 isoform X2 [Corythoichthys intestinalis]|nr:uncharacterized protein si:ch211-142k18.1 isoform X2 [Corythoichthys intestinalis]